MSYADYCFISTCNDILENGTSDRSGNVRPKWPDGKDAYTIKKFGVVNRYDLQKEFPAITLRKTALKSAMDEILWIYQRKSNIVEDLNSHIWDQWTDKEGTIGKAYGYQIGKKFRYTIKISNLNSLKYNPFDNNLDPSINIIERIKIYILEVLHKDYPSIEFEEPYSWNFDDDNDTLYIEVMIDQMDYVLYELKHNPFSRRIMTSLWNTEDLHDMNLYPCAWSVTYSVIEKKGEKYLNMFLNQRSQDMLAANNWNTAQYAILLMMVAQAVDMKPGELIHSIVDAHIYDRHIPIIDRIIKRRTYPAPKVWLDKEVKNFYDFTTDNLHVENYDAGEQVKFEVAI